MGLRAECPDERRADLQPAAPEPDADLEHRVRVVLSKWPTRFHEAAAKRLAAGDVSWVNNTTFTVKRRPDLDDPEGEPYRVTDRRRWLSCPCALWRRHRSCEHTLAAALERLTVTDSERVMLQVWATLDEFPRHLWRPAATRLSAGDVQRVGTRTYRVKARVGLGDPPKRHFTVRLLKRGGDRCSCYRRALGGRTCDHALAAWLRSLNEIVTSP